MIEILKKYGFVEISRSSCCGMGLRIKHALPGTKWHITAFMNSNKFQARKNGHMVHSAANSELDEYIQKNIATI